MYTLGERTDSAPAIRQLPVGSALARVVHMMSYVSPFLPRAFDLHADCRSLSYDKTTFTGLLRQLWHSDWAEERDATPFDVTFAAADQREAMFEGFVNPSTFYRSYTASMVCKVMYLMRAMLQLIAVFIVRRSRQLAKMAMRDTILPG